MGENPCLILISILNQLVQYLELLRHHLPLPRVLPQSLGSISAEMHWCTVMILNITRLHRQSCSADSKRYTAMLNVDDFANDQQLECVSHGAITVLCVGIAHDDFLGPKLTTVLLHNCFQRYFEDMDISVDQTPACLLLNACIKSNIEAFACEDTKMVSNSYC